MRTKPQMKTLIETKRLILREILDSDVQDMYELDADPEVHKYLGNKPITTIEQARKIIAHIRKQYENNGLGRLAVIEKASGNFLGWSGLKYEKEVREEFNYYDLGYRFKKQHWGKGYASESASASLSYGFQKLNLSEICAAAELANGVSNHIIKKQGFTFVERFSFDGEECNWYKLTKREWEDLQSK